MKVTQKLELIDIIGRELQSRYRYDEIDLFLNEYGVKSPENINYNSKWLYSKEALKTANTNTIIAIAKELDIDGAAIKIKGLDYPNAWNETKKFRLFISHISLHKDRAIRLKDALSPYGINSFVAHEDINPTYQWQNELEKALHTMDALVAIHTEGFSQSVWTQQEIGFALGRKIKIISLKLEKEDPKGFISKNQAVLRKGRNAELIAKEINDILEGDPVTKSRLDEARDENNLDEIPF